MPYPRPTLEELASWENLLGAHRKAARGKRGLANVAAFEHRQEDELAALRAEFLGRTYRPGAYKSFLIRDPKTRLISAAPFRDRVVHHALCNVIEPLFERSFIADTYANRLGKGTHRALDRCQNLLRRHPFVLQLDVRQFFPSLDHALLRAMLFAKVEDPGLRWLVDSILASGEGVLDEVYRMVYFPGDDLFAVNRPRGLPIGNLTSQFWGNVYLSGFDHFVTRRLRCGYVRYVDDLLLFGSSKEQLWGARAETVRWLERLRLTMHGGSHPKPSAEGVSFLGFVVTPERRRLKGRKVVQYRAWLTSLLEDLCLGRAGREEVEASLRGWANHARYGNTVGLRSAMLASARGVLERRSPPT